MLVSNDNDEMLFVSKEKMPKIAKALFSPTRWKIMETLSKKEMDISNLALVINTTQSNVSNHVKILRESGLINTTLKENDGKGGTRKICSLRYKKILLSFDD